MKMRKNKTDRNKLEDKWMRNKKKKNMMNNL